MLQCVAVYMSRMVPEVLRSVLQCVLRCVAVWCRVLQCDVVCCSVMQCVLQCDVTHGPEILCSVL